ncbi:DNA polymerase III subunit alpha [Fibrobacterota bacterium]
MPDFIHLQTHSEYSMLRGAARVKEILVRAREFGQKAVALTDHGNMFGILEFYYKAREMGVKPLIGCDLYIAPDNRTNRNYGPGEPAYHRIILIARNNAGYKNLMKICSDGYLDGFYQKPRIDRDSIRGRQEGLICLTGNYRGELGYYLLADEREKADEVLKFYQDQFGSEHVYLCLEDHGVPQQKTINREFLRMHEKSGCRLVAVNDVHYLASGDHEAHDVVLCIEGNYKLDDPSRPRFPSDQYYMRSSEEMVELFGGYPGAIENTGAIAEACSVEIETGTLYLPEFPLPKGFKSSYEYLAHLSAEGIKTRYDNISSDIKGRLEYELGVMKKMKVVGYMLIVQDIINAAREMGIPVGPGRGSAVGSLVSYAIGITDVDPLRFHLLFERFLNPERISMPDIDTDFSDLDRGRVIQYVVDKYGQDSVAQIVTYGRMKAKMVLRDVGRVLGFEAQELNRICKLFPPDKPFADLREAISTSPALGKELESSNQALRLKEIALKLEGLVRQAGMHAAAVIIAPEPLVRFAPLFKQPGSDQVMIQYDKKYSEDIGLLKMDFLGLRNLSVIQESVKHIQENHNVALDVRSLPEKDPKTFELIGKGMTVGVFQFESAGMQDYLRKLKPNGIEDIIAMNALYRPGPMENIPTYISRKNGSEAIDYYHPDLEPILAETYGVIVYQEQVMQIAQVLSGFTLGGADEMRRAMAKKDEKKMSKLKPKFIEGAVGRKHTRALAERIWNVLVPFSSYAFNKSHSAAYAAIAYQTAYLKAHYPAEFLAANMSSEVDDTDRLVILLNDCRRLGIEVISPNVNISEPKFICRENRIIYGLGGIKNVGQSAARCIMQECEQNGPFKTVLDLCKRVQVSDLNRRAIESLIYAGALDELAGNRAQQFASAEGAMALAAKYQRDQEIGQTSLFEGDENSGSMDEEEFKQPEVDPWPYNEMLSKEKEVLGLYLSGHPLEPYRMEINAFTSSRLDADSLKELKPESNVILGGILTSIRTKISRRDNRSYAFGILEDFTGRIEVVFWSDTFEQVQDQVEIDCIILIRGKFKIDTESRNPYKLVADRVLPIDEARDKLAQSVHVQLKTSGLQRETMDKLRKVCDKYPGECQFVIHLESPDNGTYTVKSGNTVVNTKAKFTSRLKNMLGEDNVWLSNRVV